MQYLPAAAVYISRVSFIIQNRRFSTCVTACKSKISQSVVGVLWESTVNGIAEKRKSSCCRGFVFDGISMCSAVAFDICGLWINTILTVTVCSGLLWHLRCIAASLNITASISGKMFTWCTQHVLPCHMVMSSRVVVILVLYATTLVTVRSTDSQDF